MIEKRRILVTGGAGYIGSHTVIELFNSGYSPIIIDNFSNSMKSAVKGIEEIIGEELPLYEGDCNDINFMRQLFAKEGKIEGVIHFAAYKAVGESVQEPLKYYYNNINSLIVLLQIMQEFKCHNLVFSSSCTVYGQPDKLPVTEETPKKTAESPYGKTKQFCEDILEDFYKSGGSIKSIALRYFNPVGAHPSAKIGELPLGIPNNLIPFVTQTAAGIRSQLTVFGNDYNTPDGTCVRDYIHVVDLAKAHVKSLEYLNKVESLNFYDIFNIGTGNGNTVLEVVKAFEKVSGFKLNYKIGDRRPGDVEKVYANVAKAEKLLNWKAELSLEDSIRDSWKWQQSLNTQNEYVN
jgi:UDP-glucose 4-epimerase